MLRKTTLAVIGLAASSFGFAGTMGPVCTPGNVTVPCQLNQWDFGVRALYLQTTYGANKAYELIAPGQFSEVKNDWDWGYRLAGSYHFSTGNDLSLDWTHYNSGTTNAGYLGFVPVPPFISTYAVTNQNRFDQVNLVMGQHVDLSANNAMRFYGGLQYANIQTNAVNYFPVAFGPFTSINQFDSSDFKGLGPILGIDYAFYIANGLSITANGAGSILYGNSRYNTGYIGEPVEVVVAGVYGDKKAIVPTIEAKLGLNYMYAMPLGSLNIEGGYQAINYFTVLQSQLLQSPIASITTSDYGLYGPYFGLKYTGNV